VSNFTQIGGETQSGKRGGEKGIFETKGQRGKSIFILSGGKRRMTRKKRQGKTKISNREAWDGG